MDFKTQIAGATGLTGVAADALLIVVCGDAAPTGLEPALDAALKAALADGDFRFKAGHTLVLHGAAGVKARRLVLVAGDGSAKGMRKAVSAGVAALKTGGTRHLAVALIGADAPGPDHAEALVAAVQESVYVYRHTKPSATAAAALAKVSLVCDKPQQASLNAGLRRGEAIAAGVATARECANRPGNHCTPGHLSSEAKRLGKAFGLQVEVLERKQIEKLGMGAFLAVAQGSDEPLKFIVARWQGAAKSVAPVVLVGKGITFDTGGISIKPAGEMDEMKFDMGGAASVLGTLHAVAQMKAKVNLVGIIPACENMPSGSAVKPGDVVTSLSGQTIEILNTDAEGRLVLCDALTYAERFKPAVVVDIATLTGACVIALGHHRSGLFCADDALAGELLAAGDAALDPAWRMPLDEEYDEALKSNFADMGNVGGRAGGAVTAAMFLKRYTGKYRWAHLDIAGTAWKSGVNKGGTGRPVALLTHFVLGRAG
ncbi:MAG: leucyl aminopeptidase [Rubrivivax sp.]|nr:leucyl aminopeptidase [Rubrivivax sp.]MDP3085049.1 leucyl aminopeptidase [Rubrivivax sp.]